MSSRNENLLENDLVLSSIFERCPVQDLKRMRLVCKKWNQLSLPVWRKTGVLKIYHVLVPGSTGVLHHDYIKAMDDPQDKLKLLSVPFQKYKLCNWGFNPIFELTFAPSVARFWKVAGPFMKSIEFDVSIFSEPPKDTVHHVRRLVERMPNLECLTFKGNRFHDDVRAYQPPPDDYESRPEVGYVVGRQLYGDDQTEALFSRIFFLTIEENEKIPQNYPLKSLEVEDKLPFKWTEILGMFPNLERIKVWESHPEKDTGSIIEAIAAIRKENPNALPLQALDVQLLRLKRKDIDTLKDLQLPLKSLGIPYLQEDDETTDESFMCELVSSYAKTLECLNVQRSKLTPGAEMKYLVFTSKLENLVELQLLGLVVQDLTFLEKTPNLKKLTLHQGNWGESLKDIVEMTEYLLDEDFKMNTLTSLLIRGQVKASSYKMLKKWIPNLTNLTMDFRNESLWETYELWPGLEEICFMQNSKVTDDGIIGKWWGRSSNIVESPNITSLKNLRSFNVIAKGGIAITDESINRGILKLERLNRFICLVYSDFQIQFNVSEEALQKVRENVLTFMVHSLAGDL